MNTKYAIGIDIGGTNTDMGLVDRNGNCIRNIRFSTSDHADVERFVDCLVDHIEILISDINMEELSGIGVGVPNGNYYTGCIDNAVNLNFNGKIHLRDMIRKRIDAEVVISNDANAAAYGEMIYGAAQGMRHFIMFTLGTGVGSGIVIDGKLVHGFDGYAGELGHAILHPEGRLCGCGRKGCLEQYTSARGIKRTYLELLELSGSKFSEKELENISSKEIAEKAVQGDVLAIQTYQMVGHALGLAMANAVTFSSPEAIFLMGGPVKAGKILLDPIRKSFDDNILSIYKGNVKILVSGLDENQSAILGAAALTNKV
ncbi:ROK family protein [Bacteroidales bacterium OttesenSCG-928-B11]|nr:ROK family protein [Bacteroidales bacterium OttesenSCG-928-C03]MDL2311435.1 ROK family protein [Bacteroidales bacterium OttesenSCG-928-B11]